MDSIGKCLKMLGDTVDGSEILRKNQLRVVEILLFTGVLGTNPRWIFFIDRLQQKILPQKTRQKTAQHRCFSTRMLKGLDGVFLSVLAVFKGLFAGAQTPQLLATLCSENYGKGSFVAHKLPITKTATAKIFRLTCINSCLSQTSHQLLSRFFGFF